MHYNPPHIVDLLTAHFSCTHFPHHMSRILFLSPAVIINMTFMGCQLIQSNVNHLFLLVEQLYQTLSLFFFSLCSFASPASRLFQKALSLSGPLEAVWSRWTVNAVSEFTSTVPGCKTITRTHTWQMEWNGIWNESANYQCHAHSNRTEAVVCRIAASRQVFNLWQIKKESKLTTDYVPISQAC